MNTELLRLSHIFAFILLAATLVTPAFAISTNINVTFVETVFQNVSFAKDFELTENRTFSFILGNLTIRNPSADTIYDIYVKIINTESLSSNFTYFSGRSSSQLYFTRSNNTSSLITSNITATPISIGDVDEDTVTDYVFLNGNNISFNISSEFQILSYILYNTTGTANISVVPQTFNTTINVTGIRVDGNYNDGRVFATLRINGTTATASRLNPAQVTLNLTDRERNFSVVFVPELRPGQQTVLNYTVSSLSVEPPLDINTTYTNSLYETKVLAGARFGVRDVACNIAQVGSLQIINISMYTLGVNVSNSSSSRIYNFTIHNLTNTGDYLNVIGNNTSNRSWSWVANAGLIAIGQCYNISYQIQAPFTVPTSGTYPALEQNLTYLINTTASRVGTDSIRARANLNFSASKQIISPQDNNSNNNVTWRSVPGVSANANISFTLERVTLWVTSTVDPNTVSYNLQTNYTPNSSINLTSGWSGAQWLFNFTDGSNAVTAPPPIVWVKPYWIIENAQGQILNQSLTQNGTDTYIKYIYVVNGYWLEVQKNVTSISDSSYRIQTVVRNIGNGHTPQNLTVTVYDFIPRAFTPYNFSPNFNNASNVSGQFEGTAYQWDVGLRTTLATSFSEAGAADGLDVFYMNYSVNGTGTFRVSDLYIVGLDPRQVDGANTSGAISILSGIASTSRELLYLGVVVFLVAINIGNFLMTSKINKKLDKKE